MSSLLAALSLTYAVGFGRGVDVTEKSVTTYEIRHSINTEWLVSVKGVTYQIGSGAKYYGIGFGYRWKFLKGLETSIHVGYLDNPEDIELLSRNRQFNIEVKYIYPITKSVSLYIGYNHTSNCEQICFNGNEKYHPNTGADYLVGGLIIPLNLKW